MTHRQLNDSGLGWRHPALHRPVATQADVVLFYDPPVPFHPPPPPPPLSPPFRAALRCTSSRSNPQASYNINGYLINALEIEFAVLRSGTFRSSLVRACEPGHLLLCCLPDGHMLVHGSVRRCGQPVLWTLSSAAWLRASLLLVDSTR